MAGLLIPQKSRGCVQWIEELPDHGTGPGIEFPDAHMACAFERRHAWMGEGALEYEIEPAFIRRDRYGLESPIDPPAQGYRRQHSLDVVVRALEGFLKPLGHPTLQHLSVGPYMQE